MPEKTREDVDVIRVLSFFLHFLRVMLFYPLSARRTESTTRSTTISTGS
jgi:hypothetical protein